MLLCVLKIGPNEPKGAPRWRRRKRSKNDVVGIMGSFCFKVPCLLAEAMSSHGIAPKPWVFSISNQLHSTKSLKGDMASERGLFVNPLRSAMFETIADADFAKQLGDRAPRDAAGADARPTSIAEAWGAIISMIPKKLNLLAISGGLLGSASASAFVARGFSAHYGSDDGQVSFDHMPNAGIEGVADRIDERKHDYVVILVLFRLNAPQGHLLAQGHHDRPSPRERGGRRATEAHHGGRCWPTRVREVYKDSQVAKKIPE